MSPGEEIATWLARDGGVRVRPEFLGADCTWGSGRHWSLAGHVLMEPGIFAHMELGSGRPHGQHYREARRDDGEWVLLSDHRSLRLRVGPIHAEGDRQRLARWRAESCSWAWRALREFMACLVCDDSAPGTAVEKEAQYQATWHAVAEDGAQLTTIGALVLGGGELAYEALDGQGAATTQARMWDALTRASPHDLLEYLCHSGNGVTVEWSLPFTIVAPGISVAVARLLTRLRFQGRPAEHCRELWLSVWPDTVDGALDEADELEAGGPLDEVAAGYLARLRAEHARIHPPGHLACRRRGSGARGGGAGREEVSDAP